MATLDYINKNGLLDKLSRYYDISLTQGMYVPISTPIFQTPLSKNSNKDQPLLHSRKGKIEINAPEIAPIFIDHKKQVGSIMIGRGHVIGYFSKEDQVSGVPQNLSATYEFLKIRIDEPIFRNRKVMTTKVQVAYSESKGIYDIYRRNHQGFCLPAVRWHDESICIWLRRDKEFIPLETMVNFNKIPKNSTITTHLD